MFNVLTKLNDLEPRDQLILDVSNSLSSAQLPFIDPHTQKWWNKSEICLIFLF